MQQNNELKHYGVLGMKWGVTRAKKRLSKASTQEDRDKAISSLSKHRAKAVAKVTKLEKKDPKLEKAYNKAVLKTDVKAAKLEQKRSKYTKKATGLFVSDKKAAKYLTKAQIMDMKVKDLKAQSDRAKANMAKNERMKELFNKGISDIDATLLEAGRKRNRG